MILLVSLLDSFIFLAISCVLWRTIAHDEAQIGLIVFYFPVVFSKK
ncbi:hypothetical protein RV09_GL002283 [Enterococcus moraviensis]|nr:hypothetical protein RV09_GL002283 [Enterococcus moraviensis]